jgi:hypothetical protein
MTSTNHHKTLQSEMSDFAHTKGYGAMSSEFHVIIENPISISEAMEITGYGRTQIKRFCIEYQNTRGTSGLKSTKLGNSRTLPWLIERAAAEEFKKKNGNQTKT